MKKTKYIFNGGRMSRKDNTLIFRPVDKVGVEGKPKLLPIEGIDNLYCFGALDVNSAVLNFLGKSGVSLHFFDYYEHYTGSFEPKKQLLSGKMQVRQTLVYCVLEDRMRIARALVRGATDTMVYNLRYYHRKGRDLGVALARLGELQFQIDGCVDIPMLMGIEGNCRQVYYSAFDAIILGDDFVMDGRSSRPPKNAVNALISFGNMMCYALCLDAIYNTQLNPTISFLHEPGERRFSLALDVAEIFKPILIDRTIFSLINRRQLQLRHFDKELNGVFLNESGKKIFVQAYDDALKTTFFHKRLGRNISYKSAVKLECLKLAKYILTGEEYVPFVLGRQD